MAGRNKGFDPLSSLFDAPEPSLAVEDPGDPLSGRESVGGGEYTDPTFRAPPDVAAPQEAAPRPAPAAPQPSDEEKRALALALAKAAASRPAPAPASGPAPRAPSRPPNALDKAPPPGGRAPAPAAAPAAAPKAPAPAPAPAAAPAAAAPRPVDRLAAARSARPASALEAARAAAAKEAAARAAAPPPAPAPAPAVAPPPAVAPAPALAPAPSVAPAPAPRVSAAAGGAPRSAQALLDAAFVGQSVQVVRLLGAEQRALLSSLWKAHRARALQEADLAGAVVASLVIGGLDRAAPGALVAAEVEVAGQRRACFIDLGAGQVLAALPDPALYLTGCG